MPAFQRAIDLGYRYIETDVHLSADGVLYAFHDNNLRERTGVDADFGDLDSDEIDVLLVDGVAPVPRLDEVLSTWPQARLNLDTKSDATVLPLIKTLRSPGLLDRVCVGSFSDRRIKKCRKELGPDLCTSMGQAEAMRLVLAAKGLADPKLLVGACAQVPLKQYITITSPKMIDLAHELGIQVHVWTINEPEMVNHLVDYQVDGIMTDQPDMLRNMLIRRGMWDQGRVG